MSKRCKLQKEYYKEYGNYREHVSQFHSIQSRYTDHYVQWLEDRVIKLLEVNNCVIPDVSTSVCKHENYDVENRGFGDLKRCTQCGAYLLQTGC